MQGMIAIAVPMKNSEGQFFGALAMHAPSARMTLEVAMTHIPRLKEAAAELVELINE